MINSFEIPHGTDATDVYFEWIDMAQFVLFVILRAIKYLDTSATLKIKD